MLLFRDRLSASDMLQIRKVIEHVYEKVMGQGSDGGSQTAGSGAVANNTVEKSETDKDEEMSSLADEKVELLCNDQVSDAYLVKAIFILRLFIFLFMNRERLTYELVME